MERGAESSVRGNRGRDCQTGCIFRTPYRPRWGIRKTAVEMELPTPTLTFFTERIIKVVSQPTSTILPADQ
jgi:hypothetical protein